MTKSLVRHKLYYTVQSFADISMKENLKRAGTISRYSKISILKILTAEKRDIVV